MLYLVFIHSTPETFSRWTPKDQDDNYLKLLGIFLDKTKANKCKDNNEFSWIQEVETDIEHVIDNMIVD